MGPRHRAAPRRPSHRELRPPRSRGSDKPAGPYSIDDFIGDALALMDDLGIAVFDVAGFSLGGLIAQGLALKAPDRIRRLVLVGTVANRTEEERARVEQRYQELATEGPVAIAQRSVDRWFTPEYIAEHPEVREQTLQRMAELDPAAYTAAYRVLATTDFADRVHEIQAPTLAIAGEGDVGSPPHMSEYIVNAVADGRLVVIPGVKHNMLSVTTDRIAKEITAHVDD
ncbi:alpha/beta fold hydrolase [Leucobacter soli]|uniref:alpha/beta fold hydrolase n=1 Tax=Leucobacter soli TaxID=2812850 RepID=UPI003620430C